MQMLLKCGDISNVSRPFVLADKWCDVLCEEFFRQGDLEMANGMEYTSPLNDRSHLDKPKSQIGFYSFVCLPLFQATAKAIPPLICNVQQIESNLAVFVFLSPSVRSVCRFLQISNFFQMFFIFRFFKMISSCFIFPPAGKITFLSFYVFPIEYKHMINTRIQKISVMGN